MDYTRTYLKVDITYILVLDFYRGITSLMTYLLAFEICVLCAFLISFTNKVFNRKSSRWEKVIAAVIQNNSYISELYLISGDVVEDPLYPVSVDADMMHCLVTNVDQTNITTTQICIPLDEISHLFIGVSDLDIDNVQQTPVTIQPLEES